jgi:hypothetical protein
MEGDCLCNRSYSVQLMGRPRVLAGKWIGYNSARCKRQVTVTRPSCSRREVHRIQPSTAASRLDVWKLQGSTNFASAEWHKILPFTMHMLNAIFLALWAFSTRVLSQSPTVAAEDVETSTASSSTTTSATAGVSTPPGGNFSQDYSPEGLANLWSIVCNYLPFCCGLYESCFSR